MSIYLVLNMTAHGFYPQSANSTVKLAKAIQDLNSIVSPCRSPSAQNLTF